MAKYMYSIDQFNWHKDLNTFFGDMGAIWDMENKYNYAFPSGRRQFTIHNPKTGGFRRFRLKCESHEEHWCVDVETESGCWASLRCLIFESEDGILCKVYE